DPEPRPTSRPGDDRDRPPRPGRRRPGVCPTTLLPISRRRPAGRLGRGPQVRRPHPDAGRGAGVSARNGGPLRRGETRATGGHGGSPEARPGGDRPRVGGNPVNAFNLSAWAVKHKAVVLYLILSIGAAGLYAYLGMGRAEDPSFTIKTMVVTVNWPGATSDEVQRQVADK